MMRIDLAIIVAFLAITLLLGLSHGKNIKTFRDYALGRDLSVFVLTCSLVATVSQARTLNDMAFMHSYGVPLFFNRIIFLAMIYFGAKVFIVRMAEFFGDFSVAESMGKLYGPIARSITALPILVLLLCNVVVQLKVILEVVRFTLPGLPSSIGYWLPFVTGGIIILYSALGGARSIAITDVFQFLCFGCALPIIGYLLLHYAKIPLADGWAHFKQLPQFTDTNYIFSLQELKNKALYTITPLFAVLSPIAIQRFYMAKSVQQGQKVVVASVAVRAYVYLSMFFLAVFLYLGGHVLKPRESAISYVISLVQSPAIRGVLGVTVLALLMSTVDSALHLFSIVVVNDIFPSSLFDREKGDAKKLTISRLLIVVIGAVALYGSLVYNGDIYKLMAHGRSIYIPAIGVPFAMAILGFRPHKVIALTAMMIGGAYATYVSCTGLFSLIQGTAISVGISLFILVLGHYIAPKVPATGWVGIKDRSAVELQKQALQRWWMQQQHNFKMLLTKQYLKGLLPKKESSFVILGVYLILNTLLALCFMQKGYLDTYIYWYMAVMAIGTILVIYPSFSMYRNESHFIYFSWFLVIFILFFVSSIQFAKLGHFSAMVCAIACL